MPTNGHGTGGAIAKKTEIDLLVYEILGKDSPVLNGIEETSAEMEPIPNFFDNVSTNSPERNVNLFNNGSLTANSPKPTVINNVASSSSTEIMTNKGKRKRSSKEDDNKSTLEDLRKKNKATSYVFRNPKS
ncbi:uncharacterized protein LOC126884505 [Diabrotica virgifera virgifera]|uniref:Uncharacterized protein n=1 Tax=Diabrotica virgifera virgifera TaxID=50390 RepID=A0ABM5K891_DIAVI|nr:uncharacterized protein LOC126884505 [Diabrotica virgifera virgifera]XP_050506406.1 uncharacterized protein LOC126884505 [Diabrotica virgifera virgifera]